MATLILRGVPKNDGLKNLSKVNGHLLIFRDSYIRGIVIQPLIRRSL